MHPAVRRRLQIELHVGLDLVGDEPDVPAARLREPQVALLAVDNLLRVVHPEELALGLLVGRLLAVHERERRQALDELVGPAGVVGRDARLAWLREDAQRLAARSEDEEDAEDALGPLRLLVERVDAP